MTSSDDNGNGEKRDSKSGLLRALANGLTGGGATSSGGASSEDRGSRTEASAARDLLITLISKAGKGKDEVIQLLGREIGTALVALLKQPVQELFRNQRLQITLELVPKSSGPSAKLPRKKISRASAKNKGSQPRK